MNLDTAFDLKTSLEFCERELIPSRIGVSPMAALLWEDIYPVLCEPRIGGTMIDIMTQLAERHVIRLAGLDAVVDRSSEIRPDHLLAALAVWDYIEATLYDLFAIQTGHKKKDLVLSYLREHSRATTYEINRNVLRGNSAAGSIAKAWKRREWSTPRRSQVEDNPACGFQPKTQRLILTRTAPSSLTDKGWGVSRQAGRHHIKVCLGYFLSQADI